MAKKQTVNTVDETTDIPVVDTIDPNEVLTHIICDEDGDFRVKDVATGLVGDKCKFCDPDDRTIVLTPNRANRKWANRAKVTEAIDKDGFYGMVYKESKHVGSPANRMPNAKLIAYLNEEEQEEYKAIIARAQAAYEAAKAKPMTDLEKAQEKVAKAQAALDKLLAEAAGN